MKNRILSGITILFFLSFLAKAQTGEQILKQKIDSIKMAALSEYAIKYPRLRQGFIATDIIGEADIKAELNGKDVYEGRAQMTRIRSNINIPFSQWGRNSISGSISYQQQRFQVGELVNKDPEFTAPEMTTTKSTLGFTATYIRSDSLLNRPVYYSGSISGLTDELSSIKRLTYFGSITMPVKRTQNTMLTAGLAIILDPSSPIPAFPIISYWHKYNYAGLELFIDMPSRIVLHKRFTRKSWATIGTEMGNSYAFFNLNQPQLPQNAVYSTMEFRSGASFEYLATKKLVLGVNGGLFTTATSRMFDRNKNPDDYFIKTKTGSVPYLSFSASYLPFLKSRK